MEFDFNPDLKLSLALSLSRKFHHEKTSFISLMFLSLQTVSDQRGSFSASEKSCWVLRLHIVIDNTIQNLSKPDRESNFSAVFWVYRLHCILLQLCVGVQEIWPEHWSMKQSLLTGDFIRAHLAGFLETLVNLQWQSDLPSFTPRYQTLACHRSLV